MATQSITDNQPAGSTRKKRRHVLCPYVLRLSALLEHSSVFLEAECFDLRQKEEFVEAELYRIFQLKAYRFLTSWVKYEWNNIYTRLDTISRSRDALAATKAYLSAHLMDSSSGVSATNLTADRLLSSPIKMLPVAEGHLGSNSPTSTTCVLRSSYLFFLN
jgi:hypothetical protein